MSNNVSMISGHKQHWHFVYQHRRRSKYISSNKLFVTHILTVLVSVIAGIWLDSVKHSVIAFAGALILLPGLIDLMGSLAGALGAKINHLLEEGEGRAAVIVLKATSYTFVVGILAAIFVGLAGGLLGQVFFEANLWQLLKLTIMCVVLISAIIYPLVVFLVINVRRIGYNPDDVVGPMQSSLVDILSIVSLALVADWLT